MLTCYYLYKISQENKIAKEKTQRVKCTKNTNVKTALREILMQCKCHKISHKITASTKSVL